MLDFFTIATRETKTGVEVFPKFMIKRFTDLMIRGSDFYAVWDEERGLWSTDEMDLVRMVDEELDRYAAEYRASHDDVNVRVLRLCDSQSGMIDAFHKYCQRQLRDTYHMLDETLIFSNAETNKKDYASKRLNYPLEKGDMPGYEKLISTLYSEEERHKLEWAIGSIITGDSKTIQKFLVLYGAAGTGKSTILNIIQQLFEGYYSVFDAKALGSANSQFALEAFKENPLVAIQHDGDLSKIEDNTRLNSLVSHELMTVNEKFKSTYANRFKCFLFMGTNKPVKITDGKSGLIRRLIDVHPSGKKLNPREYKQAVKHVSFELGAIAYHCKEVYLDDPGAYDDYIPIAMMGASNDFYNYIIDSFHVFKKEDGTTLKAAWEMYKTYCDEAKVPFPFSKRNFKEELKNYFWDFDERFIAEDGSRFISYYRGFRTDIFEEEKNEVKDDESDINRPPNIKFSESMAGRNILDVACAECQAQYASDEGTPIRKWDNVTTRLSDLDSAKLHYVKIPENHVVIDFDIKDENGNKSLERNLEEASKWPPTYAELSKSGAGIHLHYIYNGDPSRLSRIYDDDIEVKVFTGNSSLRRKLTKCNDIPIATISSGLPLKGDDKMIKFDALANEKALRTVIKKNLNKVYHASTKCSVDFIYDALDKAYAGGMKYDVSDMENAVIAFAAQSTNQADKCLALTTKMKFKSDEPSENTDNDDSPLAFYDVEVFPNLFLVNWKIAGEDKPIVRMINPSPNDIVELVKNRLVGFNNRRYDNHMLYGCMIGYTNEQLYNLSQKIITEGKGFFAEAYNLSYTDIYDFAAKKQSLKKWEIELGIHHQELGLPWDQPVPIERWIEVAEYCDNDVIATEAVFNHLQSDFTARQILADLAGMTVNDTTNSLTTKFIFGNNRKPQNEFCYRNLAEPVFELDPEVEKFLKEKFPEMMAQRHGEAGSLLPYFPGYKFEFGKSTYRGEEVGEGGYVHAEPGMWGNDALLDVMSMHPHSALAECIFGPRYTRAFYDIVYARVNIKHKAWDIVNEMLEGKLTPYIEKVIKGELSAKDLANALKIAINSVYGLTAAGFENAFRDPRNKDNIVAKRGALFMIDLKYEVQKRGFTVAHIKTDSIKIPDATPEIIEFVMQFGKRYGYTFEHEATYDRMCLVNDAVYIARYKEGDKLGDWTATGKQFAVPYVYKKLFTKEPILFEDMCETFSVAKGDLYLDMDENLPEDEHNMQFVGRVGRFTPIKPGNNAGVLYRVYEGKNYAAAGSKGYRWLESETVQVMKMEDAIDKSFYEKLVNDAADAISKYGDFEWFVSDDPYVPVYPYFTADDPDDMDEYYDFDVR